jgi:hypothetical protein
MPEELEKLDAVSATPLPYPYWHQHAYNNERMQPRTGLGAPWQ